MRRRLHAVGFAAEAMFAVSLFCGVAVAQPAHRHTRAGRPLPVAPQAAGGAAAAVTDPINPLGNPPAPPAAPASPPRAPSPPAQVVSAPPAPPAPPAAARRPRAKPKEPPPPSGPTPQVKLAVEAPTTHGAWTMRVTNTGDVPLRLVADARLLTLEITPRSAAKAVRCELPADMRPGDDLERPLVLPPGRSYSERFEPRLYCFGQRELDALAEGAIVTAHLGWTRGSNGKPPFEVSSIAGTEPELASLKEIVSPPFFLPDEPSPALAGPHTPRADDPDPAELALLGPRSIDAESPMGIGIALTLRNAGKRPVSIRFRPETLRFSVTGPSGDEECRWPLGPVAAMRDLFSTLASGGKTELSVLLQAYCSGHTFDQPGLVVVRPQLDTRNASGADIGLRTFDGRVLATAATIVRLHRGLAPPHLQRPKLEAIASTAVAPAAATPATDETASSPSAPSAIGTPSAPRVRPE